MKDMKLIMETFNNFVNEGVLPNPKKVKDVYDANWKGVDDAPHPDNVNKYGTMEYMQMTFALSNLTHLLGRNEEPSEEEIKKAIMDGLIEGEYEYEDSRRDYDE